MKLNHINLAVTNVAETAAFFEDFFQFRRLETKGEVMAIVSNEAGLVLSLSRFDATAKPEYPRDFHVGFIRETRQQVSEVYESLKSRGIDVNPPKHAHGGWGFYVNAPGNIVVEVTAYEPPTGSSSANSAQRS